MTSKNFNWILYSITATILVTISVQFYWNYNNYQINKQRVTNDIQISLDNALEEYYAEIAKTDFMTIINSEKLSSKRMLIDSITFDAQNIDTIAKKRLDSILFNMKEGINTKLISENKNPIDSIIGFTQFLGNAKGQHFEYGKGIRDVQVLKGKKAFDSLKTLQNKIGTILISIERDTLEYSKIDSLLDTQFKQKNITTSYAFMHFKADSLYHNSKKSIGSKSIMSVDSKSTYLKPNEQIQLQFKNPFLDTLKLSFLGISLSLLLSTAIISCLFYLLKIIKQQKQLAEVKNDLVSNITHEFKTPIATISVALESINNFNGIDDREKTKKYINISSQHLEKLNIMVEKLLETATLDSDNLELKKESIDIIHLLHSIKHRYKIQFPEKEFHSSFKIESLMIRVDVFHIENAINNILDNAVKYGGPIILIDLIHNDKGIDILISDNGTTLSKANKDRIFEKFYRVPKGNSHDIKGFGIGLYYTKTIVEKHKGKVNLDLEKNLTTFTISLPND